MAASLWDKLETHKRHTERLCKTLGVTDVYKALRVVEKLLKEISELKSYIEEICTITRTDNIGNAIKRIKSGSVGPSVLSNLPDELLRIPKLWLEGRAETRKVKGVLKMTFFHAERQHRRLIPYLQDVWNVASKYDIEMAEALKEQILARFEDSSADDMLRFCYAFLNDYDLEEDEEEQEGATKDPTLSELQQILNTVKFDYGVVSKEEVTEEGERL